MARIGLVDVDGHNYPNLPLMKLSAWHKKRGDTVEWHYPVLGHFDKVYLSKVFSFTPDYEFCIDADEVVRGGSGYAIHTDNGVERYCKDEDPNLPNEVEHTFPDYSIYGITDTAYGFLSRGCPRGCEFCHVAAKEGRRSYKCADLSEFWNGQRNIVLCDPNILACPEWDDLLRQLAGSKAWVDFNQGLDIRLMDERKRDAVLKVKVRSVHFAYDRYQDGELIRKNLSAFRDASGFDYRKMTVYVLVGFDTTVEQDLERVYWLRDNGFTPFVMPYDKEHMPKKDIRRKIARWANSNCIIRSCPRFEDYNEKEKQT